MFLEVINNITNEIVNNGYEFHSEKIKIYLENYKYTNEFDKYIFENKNQHSKIKIFENDILDVYIITWYLKAKSKIHDHAFNGCWLKVLNGKLEENVYDTNLNLVKTKTLDEGFISFISDNIGYHNISNSSNEIALTIHIYSPKNHITKYFDT